jgi:hypothetical protein
MKRPWVWLAALALVLIATVVVSGPGPNAGTGPQGTLALERLLARMGLRVEHADSPPAGAAAFVLFSDLRTTPQADALLNWARDGGTLVVADPSSAILSEAGFATDGNVGNYSFGPATLRPGCAVPEAAGVRTLAVDAGDSVLDASDAGVTGCFPVSKATFELSEPMGSGRLVALGGMSPFTNALLLQDSNATFAVDLLGSAGGTVVFGSPAPPGAVPAGTWASLPLVAKVVLIQILIALLAFAALRARRFGRPVAEHLPAPVPASELVDAVGRLYRSSRATAYAGDTMRHFTLRRLAARIGGGGSSAPLDPEALSSTLAELSGRTPEDVHRLVAGPPPANDEELIALGRGLEELRQQIGR